MKQKLEPAEKVIMEGLKKSKDFVLIASISVFVWIYKHAVSFEWGKSCLI